MLQSEPIVRDKYGFWYHSALMALEDEQPISELLDAAGMEFHIVEFFDDAPEGLRKIHEDASDLHSGVTHEEAVREWEPTRPDGENWFLLAVYDTEDGPCACFTRPKWKVWKMNGCDFMAAPSPGEALQAYAEHCGYSSLYQAISDGIIDNEIEERPLDEEMLIDLMEPELGKTTFGKVIEERRARGSCAPFLIASTEY